MASDRKILADSPQSPTSKQTGDWGENVAVDYLVSLGCAIVERQWRLNKIEIDIIAQKADRMIFVEVKTRHNRDIDPVDAVDARKRTSMIIAADSFLRARGTPFDYQFDIIAVTGTPQSYVVEHVPDAFFPMPRTRTLF